MAKIEVNKYLGSSQDNFLVFSNSDYERPYVTFYFTTGGGSGEIIIKDALDEDGYTNIRKGPGTRYAIVGKVRDDSYILCSGDFEDGWYKVYTQTGTFRGYMSAKKLEVTESPCF